jgi:hypothetical protein
MRTSNDKFSASVDCLCKFLMIRLSRTQRGLVYLVLGVLELYMCRPYFRHFIAGFLALTFAASLSAQGQFWDFLGHTQVDLSQNHATIPITRHGLHFRTIQLRVSGEPVFFDRLVIHFSDGASQELMVAGRISPGAKNYIIELPGERFLDNVEFWYYKEPRDHNPIVTVYGVPLPDTNIQTAARNH